LQRWDRQGKLKPRRSSANKRIYTDADVLKALALMPKKRYALIKPDNFSKSGFTEIAHDAAGIEFHNSLAGIKRSLKNARVNQPDAGPGIGPLLRAERKRRSISLTTLARAAGWNSFMKVLQVETTANSDLTVGTIMRYLRAVGSTATIALTANGVAEVVA